MQIHATNINGLGASQVVISFLDAYTNNKALKDTIIYLPNKGILSSYEPSKVIVKRYQRKLPNGISRFLECVFSVFLFKNVPTIVLGDLPLRGIKNQVVLVHQPNLIKPSVNSFSGKSLTFRINRFLFKMNNKYAKRIIVQTGAMAKDLIASYPEIKDKVIISPQPVPNWLSQEKVIKVKKKNKFSLFYPAAFYPHKKHQFLFDLDVYCKKNLIDTSNFEILLTLTNDEFEPLKNINFLKNLGRLNSYEMNMRYSKVDALLFISSMESYGLPLVEALTLKLPIVTVKFEYSTWMCEDKAYYFEPYNEESFLLIINKLIEDVNMGKVFDYTKALSKFPDSWEDVVIVYENALNY